MGQKPRVEIICRCNNVDRDTIENAIRGGCDTLNKIFDETSAGVGACGGSCRRKLKPMLEHYLAHGNFPEKIVPDMTGKLPTGNEGSATAVDAAPKEEDIVPPFGSAIFDPRAGGRKKF